MEIKVIGVGGIGCALLPHLCRYLNYGPASPRDGDGAGGTPGARARVTLVDGDDFEARNAARQAFGAAGNKARVKAAELAREFDALALRDGGTLKDELDFTRPDGPLALDHLDQVSAWNAVTLAP